MTLLRNVTELTRKHKTKSMEVREREDWITLLRVKITEFRIGVKTATE
jgi:uncharacterized protein YnzC (UPF0291/DUF896 family)